MMRSTLRNKKAPIRGSKWFAAGLAAVFWLAVWQLLASLVKMNVVLSPPLEVFRVLFRLIQEGKFWLTIGASFLRILCGYAAGILLGSVLAVLTHVSRLAAVLIRPLMSILKATPVASFIILLLFFATNNSIPLIIVCIMVCPLIWANLVRGIEETDRELLEMAQVFALSKKWERKEIYLPSVLKFFLPASVTAMGLAWKAGIASEVLALPKNAIGSGMYYSKLYLETADLFAWTLVVVIFSFIFEKIMHVFMPVKKKPEEAK